MVALAPLRDSDRDVLLHWINDPEIVRWNAPFRPISPEEHSKWFERVRHDSAVAIFGIRMLDDDSLIGIVQLVDIHPIHRSAELRIRIGPVNRRGRRFGREALALTLDFAWRELSLERVWVHVRSDNERALRAFQAVGFVWEGRMRHAAFMESDWRDLDILGVLRPDPDGRWDDFTENAYAELLQRALTHGYAFARFHDRPATRHILWRHDVDLSVHRALRAAEIEADLGIRSTFFVNPHSVFYSVLEPRVLAILRRILAFGHEIGLHFDAEPHATELGTLNSLKRCLEKERDLVVEWLGCDVRAFSYHNPDIGGLLQFDADEIAGMTNAYAATLRRDYVYASDSNGYWRFKPIAQVIDERHERLHILTHPEWWTPGPLAPRDRVERCATGRARACMREYDQFLLEHQRENLDR